MKASTLLLILLSVAATAIAQIMLKRGMSSAGIQAALTQGWRPASAAIACNAWVAAGLALYFLSAVVWLLVLSAVPVTVAYPFVALGFIATMLLGWGFLGEALNVQRVAGTLLVVMGVLLIEQSA